MTGDQIHERWGGYRRLSLAYCITGIPANAFPSQEERYLDYIAQLAEASAEWERAGGLNFIHARDFDNPTSQGVPAQCATGTPAYFAALLLPSGQIEGATNTIPRSFDDPELDPVSFGSLQRVLFLNVGLNAAATPTLRHEFGHIVGFDHEEVSLDDPGGEIGCSGQAPRLLTPLDAQSIMTTPGCDALDNDSIHLTPSDRLSAYYLQHTARRRFETRTPSRGYDFDGSGAGRQVLWHSPGNRTGELWNISADGSLATSPFPFASSSISDADWYPNQSEVVSPLALNIGQGVDSLLFYGPGPEVDDYLATGTTGMSIPWSEDEFVVPVVGTFDGDDLARNSVYLYAPGPTPDRMLRWNGQEVVVSTVAQDQSEYAVPIAAPFRGQDAPDDILWWNPLDRTLEFWQTTSGTFGVEDSSVFSQSVLDVANGENIPIVGDFTGDGHADIMWYGVANLPAGNDDITDTLWIAATDGSIGFTTVEKAVGSSYNPFVGDFDGDGNHDIFWLRSGGHDASGPTSGPTGESYIWFFSEDGSHEAESFVPGGDYVPVVLDFNEDDCNDIGWFDPTEQTLTLWRCLPGQRNFDCEVSFEAPETSAPVGASWGF